GKYAPFKRIYSTFGSAAPYVVFPDEGGLVVGIVGNTEHRYRDVVLPALGLNQVSHALTTHACTDKGRSGTSGCSRAGVVGVEKPDPRIYEVALRQAGGGGGGGGVAPGEALHIGDSLRKNYARPRAERWRRSGGAPVLPDLVAAQEWLAGGRHGHREEGQLAPGRPVLLARSIECLKQQTRISAI
ncbi:hypothetical protein ACJX0J_022755, partial [Zea mays]